MTSIDMNQCTKCKDWHPAEFFNYRNKAKGLRTRRCKNCTRAEVKAHFLANKEKYNSRSKEAELLRIQKNHRKVIEYFAHNHCVKCGESDPLVLVFDHIERDQKHKEVSVMVTGGYGWKSIESEIKKCRVLCANCHMRYTARQMGWSKFTILQEDRG